MKFYEVHDQDGCLIKTKNLQVAKRSARALLSMKRGRLVHIQIHAIGTVAPIAKITLDRDTLSWNGARPVATTANYPPMPEIAGQTAIQVAV